MTGALIAEALAITLTFVLIAGWNRMFGGPQ